MTVRTSLNNFNTIMIIIKIIRTTGITKTTTTTEITTTSIIIIKIIIALAEKWYEHHSESII